MKRKLPPPPPPELSAKRIELGQEELVVFEWREDAAAPPERAVKPPRARRGSTLSPKELVVAEYLSRGYQNVQIAANLGVSVHTVRHQVASILRKTGTFNRTDFAAQWLARPKRARERG